MIFAIVEPLHLLANGLPTERRVYQFPDPMMVTLCFFECAPRVAMVARWDPSWWEAWDILRAAWFARAMNLMSICFWERSIKE